MAMNPNRKKFIRGILSGKSRIDAYMEAYGTENRDYASKAASRLLMKNDEVRAELRERLDTALDEAQQMLELEAIDSVKCIVKLRGRSDKDDNVKLRAAQDILDRAGLKPKEQVEHSGDMGVNVAEAIVNGNYYIKTKHN